MKDYVRVGLIGFGKQGSHYVRMYVEHRLFSKFRLTAIADTCPVKLQWVRDNIGPAIECFDSAQAMQWENRRMHHNIATSHAS